MADMLTITSPLPSTPATFADVTISVAPPLARYSLRARDRVTLEQVVGFTLPSMIGQTIGGVACLGPDEYYARLPEGTMIATGNGLPVSVTDVSHRAVGIIVEGADAWRVLAVGCPLDLERFVVGRTARTIYELVEVIIYRESETRFHIDVWRSFAPWLWGAMNAAAGAM